MLFEACVDFLRCLHLLFFAAGMGTSLFFDFRTLYTLKKPVSEEELRSLHQIHTWITFAFVALWVTGIMLIYVRTSFNLEAFSPKLYAKLIIVSLMILNARAIRKFVFPTIERALGTPLLTLPTAQFALITQIAINSMFCWTAALILGASTVLKTAPWEVLIPLGLGSFVAMTIGGQIMVWALRWRFQEAATASSNMQVATK